MNTLKIKKGLGRGLSSLIGDTKVETNVNKLSIGEIIRNKYQPRKRFNQEDAKHSIFFEFEKVFLILCCWCLGVGT